MTDREIERTEKMLPRWENGRPPVRSVEEVRIAEELSCRGMINSILIYHGIENVRENSYWYSQYLRKYEKDLGHDCVVRLCEEQVEDFQKAVVLRDIHTDSEGVSYNSIVWADEMADEVLSLIENDLATVGPESGIGYTLPDGKYHIFAYVDFIDDERVVVLEPNKVVGGAHEPIGGDTYIAAFGDIDALRKGCDWCFAEFGRDRYGLDFTLQNAQSRSTQLSGTEQSKQDFEIG